MSDLGLKRPPWKPDLSGLPWQSRWAYHILKPLSRLLYRPRYYGLDNLPRQGPYIILANHQSFFDVMLLNPAIPLNPIWLGKKELFESPLMAPVIKGFGAIPIDREASNFTAVKQIFALLKDGGILAVFPEATRIKEGKQGEILPKAGLVHLLSRAKVPLIPICLEYPYRLFRRHRVVVGPAFHMPVVKAGEETAAAAYILAKIYGLLGDLPGPLQDRVDKFTDSMPMEDQHEKA